MTQEEVAAWVSAAAAVAQAVGAIAAIWASFRLAARAEQRAADAIRQSAERERAAEVRFVEREQRAEVDRKRNEFRSRRERLVDMVRIVVEDALGQAEKSLQTEHLDQRTGMVSPWAAGGKVRAIISAERSRIDDPDLLPHLYAIEEAVAALERPHSAPVPQWTSTGHALVQNLRNAMAALEAAI